MNPRSLIRLAGAVAAGVVLAAATACDKQEAGPISGPPGTRTLRVVVLRDTAVVAGSRPLVAGTGVRVNVFAANDTTLAIRTVTADATGAVTLVGLAAGQYIIRPVLSPFSAATTRGADTVTVAAGDTTVLVADTLRVRLGATISGNLGVDFTGQAGRVQTRFPNVTVTVQRETAVGSNTYATFALDTTDATGAFTLAAEPGPRRYRFVFDASTLPNFPNDSLLLGGTGTAVATRGVVTSAAFTLAPGSTSTQTQTYRYNTRVTGAVFRDNNKNGIRDTGEGLLAGDTVVVQLRNSAGRVVATSTSIGPSTTASYTFTSLVGGGYQLTFDPVLSRFADTFPLRASFCPTPGTGTVCPVIVPIPRSLGTTTASQTVTQNVGIQFVP
ncbi:MAG: SdrD B-like domain-containing protein [Gemmatimonadaceae bacterium]